ncbi:MAG: shikimate kinase [Akkermansia sp.]
MRDAVPASRFKHPIILIGLMGCGKSTIGRELSKLTGLPLLDTDLVIEEQLGKSIPDIFAEFGEARFRALETALLRYLADRSSAPDKRNCIISTGGGIVLKPENRTILRSLGFVVWLNVDVPALLARTARANNRPLLHNADRAATLTSLLLRRRPLYEVTAHMRLNTTDTDIPTVTREIIHAAKLFYS